MTFIINADANISGYNNLQNVVTGVKTVWVSATQVRLVPSGLDGKARISMWNGSAIKTFEVSANITADITTTDANGRDSGGGAEAASTFYHLSAIAKEDGTVALLLHSAITPVTMPTDYTYRRLIGGVANNASSDFAGFKHLSNGDVLYTDAATAAGTGYLVLSAGTANAVTNVDISACVPDLDGTKVIYGTNPANLHATGSQFQLWADSGATIPLFVRTFGNGAGTGNAYLNNNQIWFVNGARNTTFWYRWGTNTGVEAADMFVQGFNIGIAY